MIPFIDVKTPTVEELMDKVYELRRRLNTASVYNYPSLVNSIELTVAIIEEELEYRNHIEKNLEKIEENRKKNIKSETINIGTIDTPPEPNI